VFTLIPPLLPTGLTFNSSSGVLSGTPTQTLTRRGYVVQAKAPLGQGVATDTVFELVVNDGMVCFVDRYD